MVYSGGEDVVSAAGDAMKRSVVCDVVPSWWW